MSDNKYMVTIRDKQGKSLRVDVYDTLDAFPIICPALQHLAKKALFAGRRGHKAQLQDLLDIRASADRAIELYHSRRIAEEAQEDREHLQKISEDTLETPLNKFDLCVGQFRQQISKGKYIIRITIVEEFYSQFYSELSGHYHTLKNSDIIEQYPLVIK